MNDRVLKTIRTYYEYGFSRWLNAVSTRRKKLVILHKMFKSTMSQTKLAFMVWKGLARLHVDLDKKSNYSKVGRALDKLLIRRKT